MHTLLLAAGLLGAWLLLKAASPLSAHPTRGVRMASSFMLLSLLPASALTLAIATFFMVDQECFAHSAPWDQAASLVASTGVIAYFAASVARVVERRWRLARLIQTLPISRDPAVLTVIKGLGGEIGVKVLPLDRPAAFVLGWRRPEVVLSDWMLGNLDFAELEAVVAHELAHVGRKDVVLAALGALWARFVPLAALRQIQATLVADIENAADALAVGRTGRPLALASALAKFWKFGSTPDLALSGVPQFTGAETIERRIGRLMGLTESGDAIDGRRDLGRSLIAIALAWGFVILTLGIAPSMAMAQDHQLLCKVELPS